MFFKTKNRLLFGVNKNFNLNFKLIYLLLNSYNTKEFFIKRNPNDTIKLNQILHGTCKTYKTNIFDIFDIKFNYNSIVYDKECINLVGDYYEINSYFTEEEFFYTLIFLLKFEFLSGEIERMRMDLIEADILPCKLKFDGRITEKGKEVINSSFPKVNMIYQIYMHYYSKYLDV